MCASCLLARWLTSGEVTGFLLTWLTAATSGKKENYAGSKKPLPTLFKEKEPLWYRVPYRNPPSKEKEEIDGDQDGCRLDLKPSPDES